MNTTHTTHNPSFSSATKSAEESSRNSSHSHPSQSSHSAQSHTTEKTTSANHSSNTPKNPTKLTHDQDIIEGSSTKQAAHRNTTHQIEQNTREFAGHAERSSHEIANSAQHFNEVMTNLFLGQVQTATQAFINLSRCHNPINFANIQREWLQNSLHNISIAAEQMVELTTQASNSNANQAKEFTDSVSRRATKTR